MLYVDPRRWLPLHPGSLHTVTTAREECGSTWGSGRVDKFKQTITAKKDKEEKLERKRIRDAITVAVHSGGAARFPPPATPQTEELAVHATMAAAVNITPGTAAEVGAQLDAM